MTAVSNVRAIRALPHSTEAEEAVLSTVLTEEGRFSEVRDVITSSDLFYVGAHQQIWQACCELHERGTAVDIRTVASFLGPDRLRAIGGLKFLSDLVDATPAVAHVRDHAKIVASRARVRQLVEACRIAGAKALSGDYGDDTRFVLETAEQLASITREEDASRLRDAKEVDEAVFAALYEQWEGKREPWGLRGSFPRLHALMHGYGLGEVTFLAANTGGGKSAFAVQEAVALTAECYERDDQDQPIPIGAVVVALEMTAESLYQRALVQETHRAGREFGIRGWSSAELRTGKCDETGERIDEQEGNHRMWLLEQVRDRLRGRPLLFDDAPQTLEGIRSVVARADARLRRRGARLRFLVLDHLHLVDLPEDAWGPNEVAALAKLVKGLKDLAKAYRLHVLCLAQYNRAAGEQHRTRLPEKRDIRGASAIEQIADKVLLIHRPWVLLKDKDREALEDDPEKLRAAKAEVTFLLDKHRDGREGAVPARFHDSQITFSEEE